MTGKGALTTRAALYLRVSTKEQAENGISMAAQEDRCRAYCAARGWKVAGAYRDDGTSAKTVKRPELQRLLGDVKARKVDAVVVFKLDRLTRKTQDLLGLRDLFARRDVALASVMEVIDTSTAAGRWFLTSLGAMAEFERESIGERTSAALQHKRDNGQVYGAVPYGFKRAGGKLEPVERELDTVRRIHAMRRENATLAAIAGKLNDARTPTKKGKGHAWRASTVQYILRNDLYAPYLKGVRRG